MNRPRQAMAMVALAALLTTAVGCESWGRRTRKGAVIGAAGGGAVGAVIGHATGSTVRGAIIGAAVGGAAGALIGREMDKQAEEIAEDLPGAQVSRVGEGIAVSFPSGILFPFDSADLQTEGRSNLRQLADSLEENPRTEVMIVGHADATGRPTYNQGLSERRAQAAADYLVSQGIPRGRLRIAGRGESEPVASNASEEGRQQNRRVEVAIYANQAWREEARRQAQASAS